MRTMPDGGMMEAAVCTRADMLLSVAVRTRDMS
ncbi:hypothetical protein HD841_000974 [Sphingomonas melonis]|uniref:Uncharacterized protein n=1 Tax=Sphingomonas melonis TaxID=152682 RepID=A0A7Y9FL09_9SPHN|nr:hypothetical protein [Sphingomonas melonis]